MPVIVLTLEADGLPLAVDCCDDRYTLIHHDTHRGRRYSVRDNQDGKDIWIRENLAQVDALIKQAHAADGELQARKQR